MEVIWLEEATDQTQNGEGRHQHGHHKRKSPDFIDRQNHPKNYSAMHELSRVSYQHAGRYKHWTDRSVERDCLDQWERLQIESEHL